MNLGQIAHDAFHSSNGSVTRGFSFDSLRASARRLWEQGAAAAVRDTNLVAGRAMYDGYFEATGLNRSTFMPWGEICQAAKVQWEAAGGAVRALQPEQVAA